MGCCKWSPEVHLKMQTLRNASTPVHQASMPIRQRRMLWFVTSAVGRYVTNRMSRLLLLYRHRLTRRVLVGLLCWVLRYRKTLCAPRVPAMSFGHNGLMNAVGTAVTARILERNTARFRFKCQMKKMILSLQVATFPMASWKNATVHHGRDVSVPALNIGASGRNAVIFVPAVCDCELLVLHRERLHRTTISCTPTRNGTGQTSCKKLVMMNKVIWSKSTAPVGRLVKLLVSIVI